MLVSGWGGKILLRRSRKCRVLKGSEIPIVGVAEEEAVPRELLAAQRLVKMAVEARICALESLSSGGFQLNEGFELLVGQKSFKRLVCMYMQILFGA